MATKNTYTDNEVSLALNRAADEIVQLEVIKGGDELLRDAINLLVNAGVHYLDHTEETLADVIDANWDSDDSAEIKELLD